MRRIKDVLRLHNELGRGQREIARCLQIAQSTVHDYLRRAQSAGLSWPLPKNFEDDGKLEAALFPSGEMTSPNRQVLPDFVHLENQLRSHRNLTLLLLWQEYHEANPEGLCPLPPLEAEAGRGVAAGPQGRREAFRGLGR